MATAIGRIATCGTCANQSAAPAPDATATRPGQDAGVRGGSRRSARGSRAPGRPGSRAPSRTRAGRIRGGRPLHEAQHARARARAGRTAPRAGTGPRAPPARPRAACGRVRAAPGAARSRRGAARTAARMRACADAAAQGSGVVHGAGGAEPRASRPGPRANGQPEDSLTCHQPISIPTMPRRGRTLVGAAAVLAHVDGGHPYELVAAGGRAACARAARGCAPPKSARSAIAARAPCSRSARSSRRRSSSPRPSRRGPPRPGTDRRRTRADRRRGRRPPNSRSSLAIWSRSERRAAAWSVSDNGRQNRGGRGRLLLGPCDVLFQKRHEKPPPTGRVYQRKPRATTRYPPHEPQYG